MKKILTDILTTIVVFILLTLSANALKLEENNTYSGTIKDNHRNNIPLPPGDWLLIEINQEKLRGKGVTAGTIDYLFINPKIGSVYYFGPTGTNAAADHWVGRKTPSICEGNPIAGKTNISGKNNTEWCAWDNGDYIDFVNYTALHFEQYGHVYSIYKSLLRDTSKSTIQSIGSQIYNQVRKNKAGDLSFLSSKIYLNKNATNSNNSSNQTTTGNSLSEANKNEESVAKDNASIKSKLRELKSMLDEGLISQKQYDEMSSKILEEL